MIKLVFFAKSSLPGAIGCIDCTQICIQAPSVNENDFVNRKGYHSLNVQAICDHKGESQSRVLGSKRPYNSVECPVVQNFI